MHKRLLFDLCAVGSLESNFMHNVFCFKNCSYCLQPVKEASTSTRMYPHTVSMAPPSCVWFYIFLTFRENLNNETQRWPTSPQIKMNQFEAWRLHWRLSNTVVTRLLPMWHFELHALLTATCVTSTNNCHICPKKPKPSTHPCLHFFLILKRKAENCTRGLLDWGLYISPSKHFRKGFLDRSLLFVQSCGYFLTVFCHGRHLSDSLHSAWQIKKINFNITANQAFLMTQKHLSTRWWLKSNKINAGI